MQIRDHSIGVCSWSIRPQGMQDLCDKVMQLGLEHVHLALGPLLVMDDAMRAAEIRILRASGLSVTAAQIAFAGEDYSSLISIRRTGGVVPTVFWQQRRELAIRAGKLAAELGLHAISMHAGFIPQSNDPAYGAVLARVCEIAAPLASSGVSLLLETGQESASELLQFLNDLRCQNVECNFDTANLLLYGAGDPLESVTILGRHIRHVHLKDANSSDRPGTEWGREVELGLGQVPFPRILETLDAVGYSGPLVIEAEYDPTLDHLRRAVQFIAGL
jgi:sugar phosphate isomerase/epimerase